MQEVRDIRTCLSGRRSRLPEFERLMRENQRLKQLLADKELELSIKESLQKNTPEKEERRMNRESISCWTRGNTR